MRPELQQIVEEMRASLIRGHQGRCDREWRVRNWQAVRDWANRIEASAHTEKESGHE